jgi:uncharacterized protein YqjF (DUF2071 family)
MDSQVLAPSTPVEPVERPIMLQGWKELTYVHWPFQPSIVQSQLPAGLEVDTFEGKAWVGLVAFRMERIRLPRTPAVPYLGTFCETNVRTYVRGPNGKRGVWFDSLDVSRLLPVAVARATYRLPYMWSRMRMQRYGDYTTYTAQRRWPGPRGIRSELSIRRGAPIDDPSPREHFLTARWGLFTRLGSRLAYAPVDHPAWPLHRAELAYLDDEFVAAAGYPQPYGEPIVHYSPGVEVRIGLPRGVSNA